MSSVEYHYDRLRVPFQALVPDPLILHSHSAEEEIVEQAPGTGFDAVVCASGSALTHAGMLVGLRALGERAPVLGICVRRDAAGQGARMARVAGALAAMIECPDTFDAGDVDVSDAVLGRATGGSTTRCARRWRRRPATRGCCSTRSTRGRRWRG